MVSRSGPSVRVKNGLGYRMRFEWRCIDDHALPDAFQVLQGVISYVHVLMGPSKHGDGARRGGHPESLTNAGWLGYVVSRSPKSD
ncbi:hypothetical protein WN55_06163 [Dufourea novaeangliae]|uniref:Uncharacterized protein n=1 Tax=Dufourea novaeangliae TaxID=178035 RepID=A0A154P439_DUFNO|nr:hypothetical protein WN55_06163 [Dufourea novaeangliae]